MDSKEKPPFEPKNHSASGLHLPAEVHSTHTPMALAPRNQYVIGPSYNVAPAPVGGNQEYSSGLLLHYWGILLRHKKTVLLGSVAGLVLGFSAGVATKPVFRATAALEVLSVNGDFMNQKSSNPISTNDGNYETEEQTQARLLQSRALIKRVMTKLDPATQNVKAMPAMARSGWRSWLHLSEPGSISERRALLMQTAASLKVQPSLRTRVVDVNVDSTDPQLAADFANTLSQEFIAQNIETRWANTQMTSEWLQRELEETQAKLRASEDALQKYASSSRLLFTGENNNVATEKLQQLQQSLSAATADRIAKQSRYELAQKAPADSLADVLNDRQLGESMVKINDVKRELAEAGTVFVPESTKVQRLSAQLQSLEAGFAQQKNDILMRIQNDYTEASRKEKLLAGVYNGQVREVTGQDEKAIQYNILKREVDSNRQLYDTMLQQMKQASVSSAIRAGNIRVVDPAEVPTMPVSPNIKANSMLGLFCGFFLSMAFVKIRERANRTLQQPGDIKLWTDVMELGVIPSAALNRGSSYYASTATKRLATRPKAGKQLAVPQHQPIELVTAQKQTTVSAEAFRSALTSMLLMSEEGSRPRVMVFTSANAADGKTTVVSNIGIAAAEIGMKVLMIDADLRRPRLHSIFHAGNERGLSDILSGSIYEAQLPDLIKETRVNHLSLLPAGPATDAASHLLYTPLWGELLEKLRGEYDMILVDTPPMLQMSDARVAARVADAVVLVARANFTTREALSAAKERISHDRIKILGALLNDWDPQKSPDGYYGYHGDYRSNYYNANHYRET